MTKTELLALADLLEDWGGPSIQTATEAAYLCRKLAVLEPDVWRSHCVLNGKDYYDKLPLQSLQAGAYKHTKLYTLTGIIDHE